MSQLSFHCGAALTRFTSVVVLGLSLALEPAAASPPLPEIQSLPQELHAAAAIRQPLVVMVSLPNCPSCVIVRKHHMLPLLAQGVPVRQISMKDGSPMRALDGSQVTQDEQSRRWKVKVAPTVLFLGPDGRELAERLEGALLADFYAAYLEDRLQRARQVMGR